MDTVLFTDAIQANTEKVLHTADTINTEHLEPQTNKWNALEVLEHIYLTDQMIIDLIKKPSNNSADVFELMGKDKLHHILINKRDKKVKAPDILEPQGQFSDIPKFSTAYALLRNNLVDDINSMQLSIDNRIQKHFILGEMTTADWIHFMIAHTNRHLLQIEDLN